MQRAGEVIIWSVFVLTSVFLVEHTVMCRLEWRRDGRLPWWRTGAGWLLTSMVGCLWVTFGFAVVTDVWPMLALHRWFLWSYLAAVSSIGATTAAVIVVRAVWFRRGMRR